MSITRINKFEAKDGMTNVLQEFLLSLVPLIKQSQGCESCRIFKDNDKTNSFLVIEVWSSVAAHQTSVKNIPPEKIAMMMPLLASPPSGSYYSPLG